MLARIETATVRAARAMISQACGSRNGIPSAVFIEDLNGISISRTRNMPARAPDKFNIKDSRTTRLDRLF